MRRAPARTPLASTSSSRWCRRSRDTLSYWRWQHPAADSGARTRMAPPRSLPPRRPRFDMRPRDAPRPFTNHHALPPGPWPPPLASTPVGQPPAVTDCDLRSGGKPGGEEAAAAGVVLGSTIGILVAPCAAGYWEVGRRAWLHGMARSSPPMLPPHPHNPPPPPPVLIT
jgi:hypothetical protein